MTDTTERCKHGIRWPHPCDDCDEEALKPHNLIARINELEAERDAALTDSATAYNRGMEAAAVICEQWNGGTRTGIAFANNMPSAGLITDASRLERLRRLVERWIRQGQVLGIVHDMDLQCEIDDAVAWVHANPTPPKEPT